MSVWQGVSFAVNQTHMHMCMCMHMCNVPSPDGTLRVLALWQGGGIYVYTGGEATLIDSNVYQNEAISVRLLSEPSRTFFDPLNWLLN